MKLEARVGEALFDIELDRISNADCCLHVKLAGKESGEEIPIEILDIAGQRWTLSLQGRVLDLLIVPEKDGLCTVEVEGRALRSQVSSLRDSLRRRRTGSTSEGAVVRRAEMPGKVVKVFKREGEAVESGEGLVVIEAMKMQNEIRAPKAGILTQLKLEEGSRINTGELLFEIE